MREPYTLPSVNTSLPRAVSVFYSYSHKDETYRDELEKHLSVMRRKGEIDAWHDRKITAGDNWKNCIDTNLEKADLILLLVSSDFLASTYCYEIEMERAMQRHLAGEARVIPIILRACDWFSAPFAKLQALPTDGEPISSWPDQDTAYHNVVAGIRQAISQVGVEAARGEMSPPHRRTITARGKALLLAAFVLLLIGAAYLLIWKPLQHAATPPTGVRDLIVTGFVFDADKVPIARALVEIEGFPASADETDSTGRFSLDFTGKPGDWIVLKIRKEGYGEERTKFVLNDSPKVVKLGRK
ncbi:MAG: hypothetical protein QOE77_3290 [Blastocatellia bacterium]|jgi:hypothetical protein|nr:hypothetical protein [Blastocatellia bacterium]